MVVNLGVISGAAVVSECGEPSPLWVHGRLRFPESADASARSDAFAGMFFVRKTPPAVKERGRR